MRRLAGQSFSNVGALNTPKFRHPVAGWSNDTSPDSQHVAEMSRGGMTDQSLLRPIDQPDARRNQHQTGDRQHADPLAKNQHAGERAEGRRQKRKRMQARR